jgi:D-glycero-D-manno-heptose 1,7-bisphosphate phosphatase
MRKAVFLDRDGVLNKDRPDYTWRPEDFILLDHVAEALLAVAAKGYMLIVVSNQAGIARGIYTHDDVARVHARMLGLLDARGVRIDEIYYCPHYTAAGRCICRKPDSLLLEKAMARFGIDPAASYFIGDRPRDMEAADRAGVTGIRVDTDADLRTVLPRIR